MAMLSPASTLSSTSSTFSGWAVAGATLIDGDSAVCTVVRGSKTLKLAPCPGPLLTASTLPPCSAHKRRTVANPNPKPWLPRGTCVTGSKTDCRLSAAIPSPESLTVKQTCPPEIAYRALPQPVLALRADRGIEYANPAADALLVRGELLATADGRLVRAGSFGPETVRLLLSAALRGLAQQVGICVNGDSESATGVLHLTRLPLDTAFEARWPRGSVLATLQLRPVIETGAKLPALARRCGLTGAEADVLHEISSGASAKEIAEHRQVQVSTVRTQIRGLLEKTGSRRQADLVRQLLD
jgi:DNA-binding CsgD family transcriptional regulator